MFPFFYLSFSFRFISFKEEKLHSRPFPFEKDYRSVSKVQLLPQGHLEGTLNGSCRQNALGFSYLLIIFIPIFLCTELCDSRIIFRQGSWFFLLKFAFPLSYILFFIHYSFSMEFFISAMLLFYRSVDARERCYLPKDWYLSVKRCGQQGKCVV